MSGSNIGDGLVTTLVAASAFDSGNVSKDDYGIMTTSNTCALIVTPGGLSAEPHTYGTYMKTWSIEIEGYIKYEGDAQDSMHRLWKLTDEVWGAIVADKSLNSSACVAMLSTMEHPRNVEVELGGNVWFPMYMTIEALEVG